MKKKKSKKGTKRASDLLLVHKNTYLSSLQAFGYFLSDLGMVYAENYKSLPKGHPLLASMKQQLKILTDIYSAFDASLHTNNSIPQVYTKEELN